MSEMGGQQRSYKNRRREGEVTIDYTPDKKSKKYPNNSGEYVDYEEIK